MVSIDSRSSSASLMGLTIRVECFVTANQVLQTLVLLILLTHAERADDASVRQVEQDGLALLERAVEVLLVVFGHVPEDPDRDPEQLGEEARDDVVAALPGGEEL